MSSVQLPLAVGIQPAGHLSKPSQTSDDSLAAFPSELLVLERWVNWREEVPPGGKRATKVPYQPNGQHASSTDPTTWSFLDKVTKDKRIGCMIAAPYAAIDLDHVIDDAGNIEPWAQKIIDEIESYTEFSPNRHGVHIWFKGVLSGPGRKCPRIEMYDRGRYFTATGQRVPGTPSCIADYDPAELYAKIETVDPQSKKPAQSAPTQSTLPPSGLICPDDSAKFDGLMRGEYSDGDYPSPSEAVQALVCMLAIRNNNDPVIIDQKFRESGMFKDHWVQKWERLGEKEIKRAIAFVGSSAPSDGKPVVNLDDGLLEVCQQCQKILATNEQLNYFRRGGELVQPIAGRDYVGIGRKKPKRELIQRDPDVSFLRPVSQASMLRDLMEVVSFKHTSPKGMVDTEPSGKHAQHLLDMVQRDERQEYRELRQMVDTPVLLGDGNITELGYDNGVLYFRPRYEYSPIKCDSMATTPEVHEAGSEITNPLFFTYLGFRQQCFLGEAQNQLAKFDELFGLFPFVANEDNAETETELPKIPSYATLLAACLSIAAKPAIGNTPLTVASATTAGTGKTNLVQAACIAMTGVNPTTVPFDNTEEFDKLLVPILRAGDRVCIIDNVECWLKSSRLCMILTKRVNEFRILGESKSIPLCNDSVWFATGNNIGVTGDLTRRGLKITLNAGCEHPEHRKFPFDPLVKAREMHVELLTAALTALQCYVLAGQPKVHSRAYLGSFEDWDKLVVGTLLWCGFADPLITANDLQESDPARESDLDLLVNWYDYFNDRDVRLSEIAVLDKGHPVYENLAGGKDGWNERAIGHRLRKLNGKILNGYRLHKSRGASGNKYCVFKS